jgi:hypothetical protein
VQDSYYNSDVFSLFNLPLYLNYNSHKLPKASTRPAQPGSPSWAYIGWFFCRACYICGKASGENDREDGTPLRMMVRMRHKLIMWNMRYREGWIRRTLDRVTGLRSEGPRLIIPVMIVSVVADWPISARSDRLSRRS